MYTLPNPSQTPGDTIQILTTDSTHSNHSNWKQLCKFPADTNFSIILYKSDFIASTWKDENYKTHGLYKYNLLTNKWYKYMEYPIETMTSWHTMSLSATKNCLYIYNTQHNLIKIDLISNSFKIIKNVYPTGNLPNSIVINDELHIIGGQCNNKHLIWNGKRKQFGIHYTFNEFEGISGFVLVHIKSQNVIALIGGTTYKPFSILNTIYLYLISEKQWIKYNFKLPIKMTNMSYIISNNDRYILLIAPKINSFEGVKRTNKIYIIDTSTMQCKQSKILLPFKPAQCHAIKTDTHNHNNHLLVYGFLRINFKINTINQSYIDKIVDYFDTKIEYIHVIQDLEPTHFCISLSNIINGEFVSIQQ